MYLSENARHRYGNAQELLPICLDSVSEDDTPFPEATYEALVDACSEFRSALTEDLQSRRARSPVWVISQALIDRRYAARGRNRITAAKSGTR